MIVLYDLPMWRQFSFLLLDKGGYALLDFVGIVSDSDLFGVVLFSYSRIDHDDEELVLKRQCYRPLRVRPARPAV